MKKHSYTRAFIDRVSASLTAYTSVPPALIRQAYASMRAAKAIILAALNAPDADSGIRASGENKVDDMRKVYGHKHVGVALVTVAVGLDTAYQALWCFDINEVRNDDGTLNIIIAPAIYRLVLLCCKEYNITCKKK